MSWKSYVEKQNAKVFVLPDGWDSRESVADELGCSPDRVDDQLRPGIKSGEIEKQQFRVWNPSLKKVIQVTAYRRSPDKQRAPEPTVPSGKIRVPKGWTEEQALEVASRRAAGESMASIARSIGCSEASIRRALR